MNAIAPQPQTTAKQQQQINSQADLDRYIEFPVLRVRWLRHRLNQECFERSKQVDALLTCIIIKQHALLLGPPGVGKTMLIDLVASGIEMPTDEKFSWLMGSYTKPDELFGPYSLKELKGEEERYVRITKGKLPRAKLAYLDEIFKANSAILNVLLKLANERTFYNPDPEKVPLRSLFGSSNELPQGDEAEALNALADRFIYKDWVLPMQNEQNVLELWARKLQGHIAEIPFKLREADFDAANIERKKVSVPIRFLLVVMKRLIDDNLPGHDAKQRSDRRWLGIIDFLQGVSWLRKQPSVTSEILVEFLPDLLWKNPEDRDRIEEIVTELCKLHFEYPLEIRKGITEQLTSFNRVFAKGQKDTTVDIEHAALTAVAAIKKYQEELKKLASDATLPELIEQVQGEAKAAIAAIEQLMNSNSYERQLSKMEAAVDDVVLITDNHINLLDESSVLDETAWIDKAQQLARELGDTFNALEDLSKSISGEDANSNEWQKIEFLRRKVHSAGDRLKHGIIRISRDADNRRVAVTPPPGGWLG